MASVRSSHLFADSSCLFGCDGYYRWVDCCVGCYSGLSGIHGVFVVCAFLQPAEEGGCVTGYDGARRSPSGRWR